MAKRKGFKRGQLVQQSGEGAIYIFVKRIGKKCHVVELDEFGNPIQLTILAAEQLGPIKKIPENFKSIQI